MKRVIKFWNQFNDGMTFNDCGTKYEVLPILVADDAGEAELRAIAKQLGIETRGRKIETIARPDRFRSGKTFMTHAMKTGEKTEPKFHSQTEYEWHLGFVTLNESDAILKPVAKLGKRVTREQANEIINNRAYGLDDVGDFSMIPSKVDLRIVMQGWHYYHEIALLGYDVDKFERMITRKRSSQDGEREFYDSVFRCDDCGTWDSNDSGYTYNYRMTDDGQYGINCGCAHEHMKRNVEDYIDNPHKAIELEAAEELAEEGVLEHVERFIGGWTDGRGGRYNGESTREGTPEAILRQFKASEPKSKFVMTHDESGQFQTYWSLWRVNEKALNKNKRRAA
jgi:hypothetical protein